MSALVIGMSSCLDDDSSALSNEILERVSELSEVRQDLDEGRAVEGYDKEDIEVIRSLDFSALPVSLGVSDDGGTVLVVGAL